MTLGPSLMLLMVIASGHHLCSRFWTFVSCIVYVILLSRETWWLIDQKESWFMIALNLALYSYIIDYLFRRRDESMGWIFAVNVLIKVSGASLVLTGPIREYLWSYALGNALLLPLMYLGWLFTPDPNPPRSLTWIEEVERRQVERARERDRREQNHIYYLGSLNRLRLNGCTQYEYED